MKHLAASIAVLGIITAAFGQTSAPAYDPAALAKLVAPYLSEDVVMIAHLEVAKLDIDLVDRLVQTTMQGAGADDREMKRFQAVIGEVRRWTGEVAKSGGRHIFALTTLQDFGRTPGTILITHEKDANPDALASLLFSGKMEGPSSAPRRRGGWPQAAMPFDGCVALGSDMQLMRLGDLRQPAVRANLKEAFAAAGDSSVQVLILPTEQTVAAVTDPGTDRDVAQALALVLGSDWQTIGGKIAYAAGGLAATGKPALRLAVQMNDEQAADELAKLFVDRIAAALQTGGQRGASWAVVLKAASTFLQPKAEGKIVALALNDAQINALITNVLTPALRQARIQALQVASASNMRQILVSCIMYAQANNGQWPDDQAAVVKYLGPNGQQIFINRRDPQGKATYTYIKPADAVTKPQEVIVLYEAPGSVPGPMFNVGFADGHVEALTAEALNLRLKATGAR